MRYLAIDFGEKRVGLAICDPSETLVSPLGRIDRRDDAQVVRRIVQTVREEQVAAVVVGLPINMDDTEGPQAARIRKFAALLAAALNSPSQSAIPLHFQNEQLTSFAADHRLAARDMTKGQNRQRQDAIAAAVILEDFLRGRK